MLFEPTPQFRVLTGHFQSLGDLQIFGIGSARPIKEEDLSGFLRAHEPLSFLAPGKALRSTSSFNWPNPRAIRDFTVPKGTSRIAAISS